MKATVIIPFHRKLVHLAQSVRAARRSLASTEILIPVPESEPGLAGVFAAVFAAYGLHPPELNFMSQYKSLVHAYVHEMGNREAMTFWAGLGAIRAGVFWQVGGFDERFHRPSVEDIDLGYRVRSAGYWLRLDPRFRGEHLKHWTLWSIIVTDVRARRDSVDPTASQARRRLERPEHASGAEVVGRSGLSSDCFNRGHACDGMGRRADSQR